MRKPKVVKKTKNLHQSGKQPNLVRDKSLRAMYPGMRVSSSGKVYWETRKNRSDKDYKRRI